MDLGLRRILVIILGIIGGIALTFLMFFLLNSFANAGIDIYNPFAATPWNTSC
jgi:hypothetical protein